jgi:hypothetical protein
VKVDRTLVIPLLRRLTRTLGIPDEKGVGSVRLRIIEGYVFYPPTKALLLLLFIAGISLISTLLVILYNQNIITINSLDFCRFLDGIDLWSICLDFRIYV